NLLHAALGIAQVPRESVSVAIAMAARTGHIAVRRQASVVEEQTAFLDLLRLRIESDRQASCFTSGHDADNADGFIKAVQAVEPLSRLVDGQAGRTLAYRNASLDCSRGIEDSNPGRAGRSYIDCPVA